MHLSATGTGLEPVSPLIPHRAASTRAGNGAIGDGTGTTPAPTAVPRPWLGPAATGHLGTALCPGAAPGVVTRCQGLAGPTSAAAPTPVPTPVPAPPAPVQPACRAMSCHAGPCRGAPCRARVCHNMPRHVLLCHAVPCRATRHACSRSRAGPCCAHMFVTGAMHRQRGGRAEGGPGRATARVPLPVPRPSQPRAGGPDTAGECRGCPTLSG